MHVLLLGRLQRGADRRDLAFYEAADLELFAEWVRAGTAAWPFMRHDRAGGLVLPLRVEGLDEARAVANSIPSVAAGLLACDLLPVGPFLGWQKPPSRAQSLGRLGQHAR